jgi:hypothetical protein
MDSLSGIIEEQNRSRLHLLVYRRSGKITIERRIDMRIAIHDHEINAHKLYDSSSNEVFELDEDMSAKIHVRANGHLVKVEGQWILEVSEPTNRPQDPKWRTKFEIDTNSESAALEKARRIIDGGSR